MMYTHNISRDKQSVIHYWLKVHKANKLSELILPTCLPIEFFLFALLLVKIIIMGEIEITTLKLSV